MFEPLGLKVETLLFPWKSFLCGELFLKFAGGAGGGNRRDCGVGPGGAAGDCAGIPGVGCCGAAGILVGTTHKRGVTDRIADQI